jgi:hypothetical protein
MLIAFGKAGFLPLAARIRNTRVSLDLIADT